MNFVSCIEPLDTSPRPAYWFVFQSDRLLIHSTGPGGATVPLAGAVAELGLTPVCQQYLGYLQDDAQAAPTDCYCAEIPADAALPEGMTAEGLRQLYPRLNETLSALAGRAVQILAWDRTNRYCGQCGTPTENMPNERARHCPGCGLAYYPRLSPAIIIAIVRHTSQGDRLLLGRNHRFPTGRYSVLAGYVEPGESLEECAQREVLEEVGIRITNIRYFGSQPWPFPNSLMIGFTAEHEQGELKLEESELADAQWFPADGLPDLPPPFTIARRLINWFIATQAPAPVPNTQPERPLS